jgi:molybdopterin molybdotransferase
VKNNKVNVFGLPGNPVSTLVTLRRWVIPSLLTPECERKVILDSDINFDKPLTYFVPVNVEKNIGIPFHNNTSGDFFTLTRSTGFIELPSDQNHFKKGESYPYFPWGGF